MACVWGSAGRGISQVRGWQYGPVPPCPEMSVNVHLYASFDPTARAEHHRLARQGSLQAAAAASGINEKTLRRWLRDDAVFQTAYREARRQVVQQAIVQVQQATGEAVETLRQVMQAADAPASAKVSAAKTILETAVKAVELEDLEPALWLSKRPRRDDAMSNDLSDAGRPLGKPSPQGESATVGRVLDRS